MQCKHIMKTGKRRGQECGKPCEDILIDYCKTHRKHYEEEIKIADQHHQQEQERKKEEFEERVKSRKHNIKTVKDICWNKKFDFMKVKPEKTIDDMIEAVDNIFIDAMKSHVMTCGSSMWPTIMYLFPCMCYGWDLADLKEEIELRGYKTEMMEDGSMRLLANGY